MVDNNNQDELDLPFGVDEIKKSGDIAVGIVSAIAHGGSVTCDAVASVLSAKLLKAVMSISGGQPGEVIGLIAAASKALLDVEKIRALKQPLGKQDAQPLTISFAVSPPVSGVNVTNAKSE